MYKVLAIIQARMGSSRVPGKSLRKICGLPVIHHIFNRVSAAKNVDKTILATADTDADKPLIEYCLNNNIRLRSLGLDIVYQFLPALNLFQIISI